jgi:hypothetical protein
MGAVDGRSGVLGHDEGELGLYKLEGEVCRSWEVI